MSKTLNVNYADGGAIYSINNETGECDTVCSFDFLENIEHYYPDFRRMPDLYNIWLYYRDVISRPLPALEAGHD